MSYYNNTDSTEGNFDGILGGNPMWNSNSQTTNQFGGFVGQQNSFSQFNYIEENAGFAQQQPLKNAGQQLFECENAVGHHQMAEHSIQQQQSAQIQQMPLQLQNGVFGGQQSFHSENAIGHYQLAQNANFVGHPPIQQQQSAQMQQMAASQAQHFASAAEYGYPPPVQCNWQQNDWQGSDQQWHQHFEGQHQFGENCSTMPSTSSGHQQMSLNQPSPVKDQSVPQMQMKGKEKLSREQIRIIEQLPLEGIKLLPPDKIEYLTPDQLDLITAREIRHFSLAQIKALRNRSRKYSKGKKDEYLSSPPYIKLLKKLIMRGVRETLKIFAAMIAVDKASPQFIKSRANAKKDDVKLGKKKKQKEAKEYKTLEDKNEYILSRLGELIYKIDPKSRRNFAKMMAYALKNRGGKWANKNEHIYLCAKPNRWAFDQNKNAGVKSSGIWLFNRHINPLCLALIIKRHIPVTQYELKVKMECVAKCNDKLICVNPYHMEVRGKTPFDEYALESGHSNSNDKFSSIAFSSSPTQLQLASSSASTELVGAFENDSREGFHDELAQIQLESPFEYDDEDFEMESSSGSDE